MLALFLNRNLTPGAASFGKSGPVVEGRTGRKGIHTRKEGANLFHLFSRRQHAGIDIIADREPPHVCCPAHESHGTIKPGWGVGEGGEG